MESSDLTLAKQLLDQTKLRGFVFQRLAPGEDAPLGGHRVHDDRVDIIHIAGFSRDCFAVRQRRSPLITPENGLVERRVEGSAFDVLHEVLTW